MSALGHVVSVIAIWSMMLFGLRFAVDAVGWLRPVAAAAWHMARCDDDRRVCLRRFRMAVDQLHIDLAGAIQTPSSATLLFGGAVLIGLGYAAGSAGDVVKLVSDHPERWQTFDIVTDCVAAFLAVTGMSFVLAATARRRTASFLVSGVVIASPICIIWGGPIPSADETISSRVGRAAIAGERWGLLFERIIDRLFILLGEEPGHCRRNVETAFLGLPPTP